MTKLRLHTLICSTRPGRLGPAVGRRFNERAAEHGKFEAALVDLAEFTPPVHDEPLHPILRKYQHEHTNGGAPVSRLQMPLRS